MKLLKKFSSSFLALALVLGFASPAAAATSVNLGSASSFSVLAGSTITNTGSSVINGSVGLTPGTAVTGFPPGTINGSQEFTTGVATQAQTDVTAAYNAASSQGGSTVSGNLGGQTLSPGVYTSASSINLDGTLVLDGGGDANSVFIFQMGSTLTTGSGSHITFTNGAQACNVYWQVGSSATLGTNSSFAGTLLAFTSVTLTTGATINGRILARNGAVTLDSNTITVPTCAAVVVPPPPVATTTPPTATTTPPTATTTTTTTATTTAATTAQVTATTTPAFVSPPYFVIPSLPNTGGNFGSLLPSLALSALISTLGVLMLFGVKKKVVVAK